MKNSALIFIMVILADINVNYGVLPFPYPFTAEVEAVKLQEQKVEIIFNSDIITMYPGRSIYYADYNKGKIDSVIYKE